MFAEFLRAVILHYIQKSLCFNIDQITRMVSMFCFIVVKQLLTTQYINNNATPLYMVIRDFSDFRLV